jgi:hypothetical protein
MPKRKRPGISGAAWLLAALALGTSCRLPVTPAATGVARVTATCQAGCSAVSRVTVSVSRGDGPDFPLIQAELEGGTGQWTGRISGIPAGPGRAFDVAAWAADGTRLFAGSGRSDIVPGATAVVSIVLQGPSRPPTGNSFPIIDSLAVSRNAVAPGGTVQAVATAHDPDPGDSVRFFWRATCGRFDDSSRSAPAWTAPSAEGRCELSVTVTDDRGASVTAATSVEVTTKLGDARIAVSFRSWPVITAFTGRVVLAPTMSGDLDVNAISPDGDPLGYAWTTTCPGLALDRDPPYSDTNPHFGLPGPSPACGITVTVSAPWSAPAGTTATLVLPPNAGVSALCTNVSCQGGQVCDPADGRCKGGRCATVTCPAPTDRCHASGFCDPSTGGCSAEIPVSCPGGQQCDLVDGLCKAVDRCAGVTCPAPSDRCHLTGTCDPATGTCGAQPPVGCPGGQQCDPADGLCKAVDRCAAVTCPAPSDRCHVAGTCDPATGTCTAEAPVGCPGAQQCDPADGLCKAAPAAVPRPQVAKQVGTATLAGLAVDPGGHVFLAGSLFLTRSFDGISVTSAGGADALVARYDPATRAATWARAFGGGASETGQFTDQAPVGLAVTADGTVVVIGSATGSLVVGPTNTVPVSGIQDFVLGLDGATGAGRWGKAFANGLNGRLTAVAAHPAGNVFAVCGYADQASTLAPAGTAFAGGTRDAVVAMFSSGGALLWARQLGSGSDEECDALAVDAVGDLFVAGKYNSVPGQTTLDPGLGPLPGTTLGTRRHLWLAKYAGANGAPLAQAAFGSGNGNHTPLSLAVDAAGKLVVGGSFSFGLPFGATTLASAGATDGFVARLDPAAATPFAPLWAVRVGGTTGDQVNAVAVTSGGDVLAAGQHTGTTTGAAALAAPGSGSDAFLLLLAADTGATRFAAGYGDAANQAGTALAVNRLGTGPLLDLVAWGGTYAGVVSFPAPAGALPDAAGDAFLVFAPLSP